MKYIKNFPTKNDANGVKVEQPFVAYVRLDEDVVYSSNFKSSDSELELKVENGEIDIVRGGIDVGVGEDD